MALAFGQSHIPIQLVPVGAPDDENPFPAYVRSSLEKLKNERVDLACSVLYHGAAPHAWNLDYHAHRRVGRAMFWTNRIPERWVQSCNAMDEIWVPSEFNRETFAASGVDLQKLRVLRTGIDTELFGPGRPPLEITHRRSFNFLSVLNLHDRKGTELLLKAFLLEFQPEEDVALLLKTSPRKESAINLEAELAFFIEKEVGLPLEKCPVVIWIDESLSASDMSSLYAATDAFVLPTHGEACGRALLEALASEVPVITTRWGGPLDFLDDENSYLIDVEGLVPASPGEEFFAGHLWANPSLDHLRQLMRHVYVNREEVRKRSRKGRQKVVESWDWSVVFPLWEQEFQRLLG